MPHSPGTSAPLPSRPSSRPATYTDFVNPLLWVLFTNLVFSLGPSILQASDAGIEVKSLLFAVWLVLLSTSKFLEAFTVADLIANSPSFSNRTVITTILLAAHVGLLAPMFISDVTLFARFTFMLWSVTLGAFCGICLGFGLGRSEVSNKKGDRDTEEDLLS
ncbi:hypothetical protein V1506DRAFT_546436 [Lipomyces tetrasporus]